MRDWVTRTVAASAMVASLLLPVGADHAGAQTAPDQDVSVAVHINARHDGRLVGGTQRPPLAKRWTRNLGAQVSYPVIADGKVFVTVAAVDAYGTSLFALDAVTGNDVWAPVPLGGTYHYGNLTYGGGRVFALNFDGELKAFDGRTGRPEWAVDLPRQHAFTAPPTYHDGRIFVSGAGFGGTVYAVSESDGSVLWSRNTEGGADSAPVVTDTAVYVSYAANSAYAFNPATGALLWHNEAEYLSGGGRTAVLGDGRLWTRDPAVYGGPDLALHPDTGAVMGSYHSDVPPAFDGHTGFFMTGQVLEARSTVTGALLWSFAGDGGLGMSPVVVNGFVYTTSVAGYIWALDPATGTPVWSDKVGPPIFYPDETRVIGVGQGLLVVPWERAIVAYAGAGPGVRAPYIASVHGDASTPALGADTTPTVVVTGVAAGETVALRDGDVVLATKTVAPSATSVTFNAGPPGTEASVTGDRDHVLTARVVGGGDLAQPSPAYVYTLDTTPPSAPTVTVEGAASASGTDSSPLIAVSGVAAGDTIDIVVDGKVRLTRPMPQYATTAYFNVDGTTADLVLAELGSHALTARAGDPAGNVSSPSVPATYTLVADPGRFHPLPPARLLDTRDGASPVGAEATIAVPVAGRGGVPASGASAVAVNVTVTQPSVGGFLTVFPSGTARPLASSLNFVAGQTVPNLVMAKLGTDGKVNIYNNAGTAHVILDVVGWYHDEGDSTGALYNPVAPSRIRDTRDGTGGPAGAVGPGATMTVPVRGRGGVPPGGASAVILNVTVTQPSVGGFLTVFPSNTTRPLASNLNFVAGQTVPNLVVAKLGIDGGVGIYNSAGTTHVIVDLVGWYGEEEATIGSRYSALAPSRILDTRTAAGPVGPAGTITVPVAGHGGVPASASAVVVNVTVTQPSVGGFLTVFPGGTVRPLASNLNFLAAQTVPNLVVAKLGSDGTVSLYNSAGTTHVILDVVGWYGPVENPVPGGS